MATQRSETGGCTGLGRADLRSPPSAADSTARNASLACEVQRSRTIGDHPTAQVPVRPVPIQSIRKDGQTQHRAAIDLEIAEQYAALMQEGVVFPPVRLWWDGKDYWLTDGFHRIAAAERVGITEVPAELHSGTLCEAQWDSYAANAAHGMRRTWAETQRVIQLALQHPNCSSLSNVQIAKHLHLPEATVRRWRKRLSSSRDEGAVRMVTRGKSTYALTTANIGRPKGGARPTKSQKTLREELAEMKEKGSPDTRALLNIVGKWVLGPTTAAECLDAIERAVRQLVDGRRYSAATAAPNAGR
jgi:hypothetical protein